MAITILGTTVIDDSRNIIIGSGTTAQRPAEPVSIGTLWFNTSLGVLEGWTAGGWVQLTLT